MKDTELQETHKALSLVYFALLFGFVSFGFVACFLFVPSISMENPNNELFQVLIPIVAVSAVLASFFLHKKWMLEIRQMQDEKAILAKYRTACIVQWALIESPVLFSIVVYLQTYNLYFIYIGLGLLIYYLTLYPKKSKLDALFNDTYIKY